MAKFDSFVLSHTHHYIVISLCVHCVCVCMCVFVGRKKSLRSLEIPLDNLLSGIIYTAGMCGGGGCGGGGGGGGVCCAHCRG